MSEGPTYWFHVRYGEGETALFNSDCWAVVLCDYMKERCNFAHLEEPVDLLDEAGNCVKLQEVGKESAKTVLKAEGTYTLCKVQPTDDGSPATYETLLAPPTEE